MNLRQKTIYRFLALFAAAFSASSALACDPQTEDCVEVGKWEFSLGIGAGVRTNPVEDASDIPLFLLPEISYSGERFFIQNLDLGVYLWESESQQLNLLATPGYDDVFFHRWSPSNFFLDTNRMMSSGALKEESEAQPVIETEDNEFINPSFTDVSERDLRDRHMAGLAGIEYNLSVESLELQLQYLSDFTGVHEGQEARASLAKHWVNGRHHLVGSLGAVWQSSKVVNYYYGLTPAEADERGPYTTDAAVSGLVRVDWNYQLTQRWDLRLLASYRQLPDEISASPLINDNKVITVFIGGVYHF